MQVIVSLLVFCATFALVMGITALLRPRIAVYEGKANLILVSHGSTAAALTGEHPAMGEVLVLTPAGGDFRVAGRIFVP